MKRNEYTLPMRIIAMVLSLVMVLAIVPVLRFEANTVGLTAGSVVADANTMDEWKSAFLPENLPSTDYAGAIWTDKTVLTKDGLDASSISGKVSLTDDKNFLVALSALATNSVVTGSGSMPTDVVFVLDVSGSMNSTALSGMVAATNNAIRTMMQSNPKNRVGVILYSNTVTTLLPLDHYTGATSSSVTTPTYLTYLSNQDVITTGIGTISWSWNGQQLNIQGPTGSNGEVEEYKSCSGGTYIQGGLWAALQDHFGAMADTENRVPAVILMSDGAPTYVTNNFDAVEEDAPHGAGDYSFNGDGFVTGLTISYLREQMKAKYGRALIYTVGFGLGTNTQDAETAIATKVLNPDFVHQGIDDLWADYQNLAAGGTMNVRLGNRNNETTPRTVIKSSVELSPNYVDQYLSAADAGSLNEAFQDIVNDIALQAGYYPTRTDDNGVNYSGYVTFSDTLGPGMAVTQMKGILLDGVLHDGHRLAELLYHTDVNTKHLAEGGSEETLLYKEWLGTIENPTDLGNEFVWAVKQRMGITGNTVEEANQKAWELIGSAWSNGHLRYDPDTEEFSNFIVWYGNADGAYIGAYGDGTTVPEGAAYINYCYGMLGASSAFGLDSDMMYITVQMSRDLQTGDRMVTFRIPAAMLPTLTYQVDVELDEQQNIKPDTATISVNDASPIVLLYEVGVDETLVNPLTIQNYGDPTGDGRYYLYASAWSDETNKNALKNTRNNGMTYAYFEPGPGNEHYFFTDNTLLYNADGTLYTGSDPTQDAVYVYDTVYSAKAGTGTVQEGVTVYQAEVHAGNMIKMAAEDLAYAEKNTGDGTWYMPAGTMYANTYDYDLKYGGTAQRPNTYENNTGTHGFIHYHIVDATVGRAAPVHYELMYQGNNGRLTYEPAQGITLKKELTADAVGLEGETFEFTVTVTGDTDGKVMLGNEEKALDNNRITVSLKANETVTIWGMDTGASYTVTENISDDDSYIYQLVKVNGQTAAEATGTVAAYTLSPVVFTNDTVKYGAFTVAKQVTYNNGAAAVEGELETFTLDITLEGLAGRKVTVNNSATPTVVGDDDKITVTVQDGQIITISNVPVGTAYSVEERTVTASGYSFVGYTDSVGTANDGAGVVADTVTGVVVHNSYTPSKVDPLAKIAISGKKYLRDGNGNLLDESSEWNGLAFDIQLQYWNPDSTETSKWETLETQKVSFDQQTFSFNLARDFTAVGTYAFRIYEAVGDAEGVTYDQVRNVFDVTVTDKDLDGALEIDSVVGRTNASGTNIQVTPGQDQNTWNVTTSFHNIYDTVNATWIPAAVKVLEGRDLRPGEFNFLLTGVKATDNATDEEIPVVAGEFPMTGLNLTARTYTMPSGQGGNIVFPAVVYTSANAGKTYHYTLQEVIPQSNGVPGVTYDPTVYRIEVKVTTDGNVVVATPTVYKGDSDHDGAMLFTNKYQAASVDVAAGTITANKDLFNRTPGAVGEVTLAGGEFSFDLKALGENPMPEGAENGVFTVKNSADGLISIPEITFTKAGQYQYTLTEQEGNVGGYTYDTKSYTVTVVVTDPGNGQLVLSSVTYVLDSNSTHVAAMTFTNEYLAQPTEPVNLGGTKTLDVAQDKNLVRPLQEGEFSFRITGNGVDQTVKNDANGKFFFDELIFDRAGVYEYTVSEVKGELGGVKYADKTYAVKITVTDNGEGKLVAAVLVNDQDADLSLDFTNTYDVSNAVLPLTATKSMSGRQPLHDEFLFQLKAVTPDAPMPAGAAEGVFAVKNGYRGLVDFGTIVYTAAGEYKYTMEEIEPTTNKLGGVTYDKTVYSITVTVTDSHDGALVAVMSVENTTDNALIFHNQYQAASVTVTDMDAGKTLTNVTPGVPANQKDMAVNAGDYSFKLTAGDASYPMPAESAEGQLTVKNLAGGAIEIPDIRYDRAGVYTYTLEEIAGNKPGYSYDTAKYTIVVTVTDPGDGQLVAAKAYYEGEAPVDNMVFENTYLASPTSPFQLGGTKVLQDRPAEFPLRSGEFSFILTPQQNAPMPEGITDSETKANVGNVFTFSGIVFDAAGEYKYTVKEVQGNTNTGIIFDQTEYTVTVTVTDNGEGKLVAELTQVSGREDKNVVFTNRYKASATDAVVLEAVKELADTTNNKDLTPTTGDFSFILKDADGKEVETVKNVVEAVTFTGLVFDAEGRYVYTISEVKGDLEGMTYDETVYTVTVTVTDNGAGKLEAEVAYNADAVFHNTFEAPEEPPKTADDFSMNTWLLMMSVSAVGLLAVIVIGKKKEFLR